MDESKPLDFWINNDGLTCLRVDPDKKDGKKLTEFFDYGFSRRDYKYGGPEYKRKDPKTGIYRTTRWELAEAFFSHFHSKEFSRLMLQYARDPEGPMEERVSRQISGMDDFLHYGFIFQTMRHRHRKLGTPRDPMKVPVNYQFWQIYVPGYTSAELKKIIPNRFQSKTKVQGMHIPEGVSPILVERQKKAVVEKLRDYSAGHKVHDDQIALQMMARSGEISERDILQARFYRRWCHPVVLLDNTQPGEKGWMSTMNNLEMLLDTLSLKYPRLSGLPFDSRGQTKDFSAEYLFCG
ncbi:hypothetical protein COY27_02315 [Candidatus Woesearchaeota archaeon CG_4_10_14_0_2_um_filter_33_13]|nr:MAG: hypothetical protein COY27_02315 [Candidatus Woesearchaeota archaeon CG_4_10_14_0_2_um_filter_33_13]